LQPLQKDGEKMGKLIKKLHFGNGKTAKRIVGKIALSALGSLGQTVLDGWQGSVELKNGRELRIQSLPADHPYFAVSFDRKKGTSEKIVTTAMLFTLIAVTANILVFKTHNKRIKHANYNRRLSV
jgi:hypothetical protein